MKTRPPFLLWTFEHVLPWLVLVLILSYTYAKFFRHSFGFRAEPSTGLVVFVFDQQPEPTLREGDQILFVGQDSWEELQSDLNRSFFEGYDPGDVVPLTVERDGQRLQVNWVY